MPDDELMMMSRQVKTNLFNQRLWKNHTRKNWRKRFKITYKL